MKKMEENSPAGGSGMIETLLPVGEFLYAIG